MKQNKVYHGEWAGCSDFKERQVELRKAHQHFQEMVISGEIKIDVPNVSRKRQRITSEKFKTITIWGKEMRITIEEYRTHYLKANLIKK